MTFRRTRFVGIGGDHVQWRECVFEQAILCGRVDASHMLGCDSRAVDFSDRHLVEGTLLGTRGTDVALPAHENSFAVTADVFTSVFLDELPRMSERSREGVAALERDELLELRLEGSGEGAVFWRAQLIADIFDIELADATRIVVRLTPFRLARLT